MHFAKVFSGTGKQEIPPPQKHIFHHRGGRDHEREETKNEEKIDNEKLVSWLKFISNPNEMEEKDMEEENMKDAIRILEDINSNKYERDWAERRLDWCRRRIDEKEWAKKEGH